MIRKTALQIGGAALCALVMWNGYAVVRYVRQMQRIAALTMESSQLQAELSAVLKDVSDMEAGQRGYLLTNNALHLQPYTEAKDRIGADFSKLRDGLANRDERDRSLEAQVESLVNSQQSEMEHSITLRRQGYRRRAFKLVDSSEGMESLDRAREQVSSLILSENNKAASVENERNVGLGKILKQIMVIDSSLLALIACLFAALRYDRRELEQEAAQSAQALASHDFQLAKVMHALSNEARSKISAIEANARLLLQEYGGFLPRHAHECAEQIEEASADLEQLRRDLVGDARSNEDEKEALYQAVA